MKNIRFVLLVVFSIASFKIHAGCCAKVYVTLKSDPYKEIQLYSGKPYTITCLPGDSIGIRAYACGCYIYVWKIFFNDSLIPVTKSILSRDGNYRIRTGNYIDDFNIVIRNIVAVGVTELQGPGRWLSMGPNPSRENFTVQSSRERLKSVTISNLKAQVINVVETDAYSITLPTTNYPPGIYFVRVATVEDKIVIRKLIVQ